MDRNLPFLLALNRMQGVGPKTIMRLLKLWPDLKPMFAMSAAALQAHGLPCALAETISAFDLNQVDQDFKWLALAEHHHLLSWNHEQYPALLKQIANPPPVLYAKGNIAALNLPKIAIIGTRSPSVSGSSNALIFAKSLSEHGLAIVSGLALGVDAQAHIGCLQAQGQTIAVLGTGIDRVYPAKHQKLAAKIPENGLLISEFPLNHPPKAGHFPQRNRIIAGLSNCVLVIEAAVKSGSLITAYLALEQNRDVLALPGSIHNPLARGCHQLIQEGAKLITSVADVLTELNIQTPEVVDNCDLNSNLKPFKATPEDVNFRLNQTQNQQGILRFINFEVTSVDQLVETSGLELTQIIHEVAQLELQGTIAAAPGGYVRTFE